MKRMILGAAIAALLVAAPAAVQELGIERYDAMPVQDQARFVSLLLDGSEQWLRKQGKPEAADRLVALFDEVKPGKKLSEGFERFAYDLETGRRLAKRTGRAFEVEHALLVTYSKFGIEIPKGEIMSFAKDFRPAGGR